MKKEHNWLVYQNFVEEMVDTDTTYTNTGIFEYKGKSYVLVAEIREQKSDSIKRDCLSASCKVILGAIGDITRSLKTSRDQSITYDIIESLRDIETEIKSWSGKD